MNDQNDGRKIPTINTDHLQHGNAEGQPDSKPRNPYYQHYSAYPPTYPPVNHYPPDIDPYYGMPPLVQGGYPYDNYQYHQPQNLCPPPAPQLFPPPDNPQIQNLETQVQVITQNLTRIVNMMGDRRGDDSDEEQSRISAGISSSDWSEEGIGPTKFGLPLQRQGQRNEGITRSR
ncbi:hypothetical protein ACOSP7_021043 [Xanthoceras sorbifolium]